MSEEKKALKTVEKEKETLPPKIESKNQELSQIEAARPSVSEHPDTNQYFIGSTPDYHKTYLTLGGKSFPVFTTKQGKDQTGQDVEIVQRGSVVTLSDSEVEKLKACVLKKGLRFVGDGTTTFQAEGKGYEDNEYPCAMFVYLHKVNDLIKSFPLGWRENAEIPTMMKRDEKTLARFGNGWRTPSGELRPLINKTNVDKIVKKEY